MFILFGSVILLLGINSKKIIISIKSGSLEKKKKKCCMQTFPPQECELHGERNYIRFFFFLLTAVTPVIKQNQA